MSHTNQDQNEEHKMPESQTTWPSDPLPNPLYVVFCRLCFEPGIANDTNAAMQQVLLDAANEVSKDSSLQVCIERPSPYGRFLGLPQAAKALDAGQRILDHACKHGVRLAVGVAAEARIAEVRDVDRKNVIGPTINMAARLAFHPDGVGQVLATPSVADAAQLEAASYRDCFGPLHKDAVKRTPVQFRALMRQVGSLPGPPQAAEQLASVSAVVYDIQDYSSLDLDDQRNTFETLNREVVEQLQAVGATDIMRSNLLWYAPAGDGGGMLFDSGRADAAWTFARSLCNACKGRVPIRIGIATGTVAVLARGLPVGGAILIADALSSYPPAGEICVSRTFWNGRSASVRKQWQPVSQSLRPEHAKLLSEAWVLEPPASSPEPQPQAEAAPQPPQPEPQPQQQPPVNPLTPRQMKGVDNLLRELAQAYPDQTSATMLLLAVGFPMHQVPRFDTPIQGWFAVYQRLAVGAPPGKIDPLLARAAGDYPHNPVFKPYAG